MNSDARLDIRIPSSLKEQVQNVADAQDRSKAYIVIQALKQYLSGGKKP